MKALGNKVLVEIIEESESKTEGGLILVENKKPLTKARVLNVSEDIETPSFTTGDIILFEGAGVQVDEGSIIRYEQAVLLLNEA